MLGSEVEAAVPQDGGAQLCEEASAGESVPTLSGKPVVVVLALQHQCQGRKFTMINEEIK